MALLEKSAVLKVAYEAIDKDHEKFIDLLNALYTANNTDFPALFQQLYEHTEQHFERENQLMTQSAYPGIADHKAEHQRILGEFKQFKSRVEKGLIVFGRAFVKDRLPQWLVFHVTTMDTALATHLNHQPPV
jgi:hemerythrin-like metal-binding protein